MIKYKKRKATKKNNNLDVSKRRVIIVKSFEESAANQNNFPLHYNNLVKLPAKTSYGRYDFLVSDMTDGIYDFKKNAIFEMFPIKIMKILEKKQNYIGENSNLFNYVTVGEKKLITNDDRNLLSIVTANNINH